MRPHSGYRWYRPGGLSCSRTWSKKPPSGGGALEFGFGSAAYHPLLGALQPGAPGSTGVVLTGALTHDEVTVPALPVYCPRCDQDSGGIRGKANERYFSGVVRSPIRAHSAGLAQSTQLLLNQLHRSMGETPEESRTIVFTDSRDDAARTAAGSNSTTSVTSCAR